MKRLARLAALLFLCIVAAPTYAEKVLIVVDAPKMSQSAWEKIQTAAGKAISAVDKDSQVGVAVWESKKWHVLDFAPATDAAKDKAWGLVQGLTAKISGTLKSGDLAKPLGMGADRVVLLSAGDWGEVESAMVAAIVKGAKGKTKVDTTTAIATTKYRQGVMVEIAHKTGGACRDAAGNAVVAEGAKPRPK